MLIIMNEHNKKLKKGLERLKKRYFRPVVARQEGLLTHFGDCDIYQAGEVYGWAVCTCGLIHDLGWLDSTLVEKIYPKYWTECGNIAEPRHVPVELPEDFQIEELDRTEIEKRDYQEWELIRSVFGEDYTKYLQYV